MPADTVGTLLAKRQDRQERLELQSQLIRPGMTEFARRTGFTVYLVVQAGVDSVCARRAGQSPASS
ncbi:DNA-binding IclR family transcriptional regulator [Mycoplana sp. BE70]|nr:DNA-binding IclR family transcriptional regulator [Mycoplana sp. BE70]